MGQSSSRAHKAVAWTRIRWSVLLSSTSGGGLANRRRVLVLGLKIRVFAAAGRSCGDIDAVVTTANASVESLCSHRVSPAASRGEESTPPLLLQGLTSTRSYGIFTPAKVHDGGSRWGRWRVHMMISQHAGAKRTRQELDDQA